MQRQPSGSCNLERSTASCASVAVAISDAQFATRPAFHKPCPARIISDLQSYGINYRQKIDDLLSEPKAPSLSRQFSDPVTAICQLRRLKSVAGLYVGFNGVSLLTCENYDLGDRLARHRFDANRFDREEQRLLGQLRDR